MTMKMNNHPQQLLGQIVIFLIPLAVILTIVFYIATKYTSIDVKLVISFIVLMSEIIVPNIILGSIAYCSDKYIKFKSHVEWKEEFFGKNSKRFRAMPYKYLYAAVLIGGFACIPDILYNYPLLAITFHLIALTLSIHNARLSYRQFREPRETTDERN